MNLYEVLNGYMGESYVRVYIWTDTEESARDMALQAFSSKGYEAGTLHVEKLFSQDDKPFATLPSDSGWDIK